MAKVLTRSHGLPVDHIAIGVPDMPGAVHEFHALTGVTPYFRKPEPGQWYWSAGLRLGEDSFLEILGPNPKHPGFHPLKTLISGYDSPQVLFWYIATDDFDGLVDRLKEIRIPVERIETIHLVRDNQEVHYKRGIIGPGFVSQRPCVIQWRKRVDPPREAGEDACRLKAVVLRHPDADKLNRLFSEMGIGLRVEPGPSRIALDLETPKGTVRFENPGEELVGFSASVRMARLFSRHLRCKLRAICSGPRSGQ